MPKVIEPLARAGGGEDEMERRQAMALAAAGALMGAAAVAAGTSGLLHEVSDAAAGSLSFGAPAPDGSVTTTTAPMAPVIVTEIRDVYDTVVVGSAGGPASAPSPSSAAPSSPGSPSQTAPGGGSSGPAPTATTTPGAPPTTQPGSTTTTTRPPGVPADWPADKPIPPVPPGCEKPQLEDDGHWNCDH